MLVVQVTDWFEVFNTFTPKNIFYCVSIDKAKAFKVHEKHVSSLTNYYTITQINQISKRLSLTQAGQGAPQFPAEGFDPEVQQHKCDIVNKYTHTHTQFIVRIGQLEKGQ